MGLNVNFRMAEIKDVDKLYKFLLPMQAGYRGYVPWLKRAIEEFYYGPKKAILGFNYEVLVASSIFQSCKHLKNFCELKNARTIDKFARRYFFSFMLRQVETISKEEGKLGIICDVRSDRINIINLLKSNGYKEIARADLYNEGYEDFVMSKSLVDSPLFNQKTNIF